MKQLLTWIGILLMSVSAARTQAATEYALTLTDGECAPDQQVALKINLSNINPVSMWQADLELPSGISIATDAFGDPMVYITGTRTNSSRHALAINTLSNGKVRFLCSSVSLNTFLNDEGEIATVTFDVASTMAAGVYDLTFSNILIVEPDATDHAAANYTAHLTVSGNDLHLVDGTPYSNPTSFDVNTFTYTRTFNNKNWQVLYLPVALDYNDWKDDFDMAEMWAVHVYDDDQDGVVDRNEMELIPVKTSTEANKVFFIRAKSTGTKVITKTNCTVEATVENTVDCSNTHYKFVITGNYDFVSGQTMFDNLYYAPVGGNWKRAENNVNALNPFRAYMQVLDRSNNAPVALARTIHIYLWDEEEENASALDNIKENQETEVIVESMHIGLRPGRYTINGRKIVVK